MKIKVIGLGHLGTVAAAGLAAEGHDVTGLDVDRERVATIQAGHIPFYEPGLQECAAAALALGNLRFSHPDDFDGDMGGVALVAAGTPAADNGEADLSQVRKALDVGEEQGATGAWCW